MGTSILAPNSVGSLRLGLVLWLSSFVLVSNSPAQITYTWNGGGTTNNWSNANNWDVLPVSADTSIISLAGIVQNATNQDLASPFILNQLIMQPDAANGFSISGSGLQFAGSGAELQFNGTSSTTISSALRIDSSIDFNISTNINIVSTTGDASPYDVALRGPLSAASGTIVSKIGNATGDVIILSSNNTFSGTWLNTTGITVLGATNALGRGAVLNVGGSASVGVSSLAEAQTATSGTLIESQSGAFSQSIGSLVSTGGFYQIGDTTDAASLTFGFNNSSTNYSGRLLAENAGSHLAKVGTGTFTYTGSVTNFNGSLSVRDGIFLMQSANGRLVGTNQQITVYSGATLRLNSSTTNQNDRIGDTATVTLNGGVLRLDGVNTSGGTSESFESLQIGTGESIVQVNPNIDRSARFNITNFTNLTSTGTVFFRGDNLGSQGFGTGDNANIANVRFANAPTLVGGGGGSGTANISILANAYGATSIGGSPSTFVTYDSVNDTIRALTISEYATTFGGDVTDNVRLTTNTTVSTASTANALRIDTGTSNLNLDQNLTLTAGALLNTTALNINGAGVLSFGNGGSQTAYITSTAALNISAPISAAHLAKSGSGVVTLLGSTTLGANGIASVNSGTLAIGSGGSINATTFQVSKGATFDVSAAGLILGTNQSLIGSGTVVGNIQVNNGGTIAASSLGGENADFASPGTLNVGNVTFNPGGTLQLYLNGSAEGSSLYTISKLNGSGDLDLTGLSAGNQFTIKLTSLAANSSLGDVYDFDTARNHTWDIASFSTINGFDADNFFIDTSTFSNKLNGNFSLQFVGSALQIVFITAVPEPTTTLLISTISLGLYRLTRRKRVVETAI